MADEKNIEVPVPTKEEGAGAPESFYNDWSLTEEDKGFIQNSKYSDPAAIIKALRETKAYVGLDKNSLIKIPKPDAEGKVDYSEVFKLLGRPEKPEEYGLEDTDFAKKVAPKLHELGITKAQAENLSTFISDYNKEMENANNEVVEQTLDKQVEGLKKQWGSDFEVNKELVGEAVREVTKATGMTKEDVDKLERTIGLDKAWKLFLELGNRKGGIKDMYGYAAGQETPEIAKFKLAEMKSDKDVAKRLANKDSKTIKEINRLTELSMA